MRDKYLNIIVSLALTVLYCLTTPTHLPDADGPQFVVIGITGGIAHPPGYPLYCSLLRFINLFCGDPESSFAAFAYFSAISSGAAAFVTLDMLRRIGMSSISRITAVGIIFTSFSVWHISNNVEPFALNLLLCALVFWFVARLIYDAPRFPFSSITAITSLGILFGLGICNHHTQAFLVPMTAYAIIKTSARRNGLSLDSGLFIAGLSLGLIPLLYFFITDLTGPMVWGLNEWQDQPLFRLFRHLLRMEYGTFRLAAHQDTVSRAIFLLQQLAESTMYVGIPLCLFASWAGIKPQYTPLNIDESSRRVFLTSALINLLPIMIFFVIARAHQSTFSDAILSRFVALPSLLLCPLMALGTEEARRKTRPLLSWPITTVLLAGSVALNLGSSDRRFQRLPEFTVKTMLDLSRNGFLLGESDFLWAGVPFLQVVRRTGTDVRFMVKSHLENKKYRETYFRKWGLPYFDWKKTNDFFDYAVANGGLSFEAPPAGNSLIKRVYSLGPLYIAGKVGVPEPPALFRMNEALYSELEKSSLLNKSLLTSDWELFILRYFAQPWAILSELLRDTHPDLALKAESFKERYTSLREQIEVVKIDK